MDSRLPDERSGSGIGQGHHNSFDAKGLGQLTTAPLQEVRAEIGPHA